MNRDSSQINISQIARAQIGSVKQDKSPTTASSTTRTEKCSSQ